MLRAGAHGLKWLGLVLRPLDRWIAIPMPGCGVGNPPNRRKSAKGCHVGMVDLNATLAGGMCLGPRYWAGVVRAAARLVPLTGHPSP